MSEQVAYSRRTLELRAAEYYASIRKPEGEWKSIDDLLPQRLEFAHLIHSAAYPQASELLRTIDYDYMHRWRYYEQLEELHTQLRGRLDDYPAHHGDNLDGLGRVRFVQGAIPEALSLHEKALKLARTHHDRYRESCELERLGAVYLRIDQLEKALILQTQALAISQAETYRDLELRQRARLAVTYYFLRQIDAAIREWLAVLPITQELNSRQWEGVCLASLGSAYRRQGKMQESLAKYAAALPIVQGIGDREAIAIVYTSQGVTCRALGQYPQALQAHQTGLEIANSIGHWYHQGVNLNCLGKLQYIAHDFEQAVTYYNEALAVFTRCNGKGSSYTFIDLGEIHLSYGDLVQAKSYFSRASAMQESSTRRQARLKQGIAELYTNLNEAAAHFTTVVTDCQDAIEKASDLYENHYTLAAACVGQAVCDPQWLDFTQRLTLLTPAMTAYRRALAITAAPGVVDDALRDLAFIRAVGITGLEPGFALLEEARNE